MEKGKDNNGMDIAECFFPVFVQCSNIAPQSFTHSFSHSFLLLFYHWPLLVLNVAQFLKALMAMSSSFLPGSWNLCCRTSALFLAVVLIPAQILTAETSPFLANTFFSLWWCFQSSLRSHKVPLNQSSLFVHPR